MRSLLVPWFYLVDLAPLSDRNTMAFLFIRGVSLADLNAKVLGGVDVYDSIPSQFDPASWPHSTNVACGYCGLKHQRIPVFVPSYINDNDPILVSPPLFCSFACANSYLNVKGSPGASRQYLLELYSIYTGKIRTTLPTSPDPILQKRISGNARGSYSDVEYLAEVWDTQIDPYTLFDTP
jgi:hypothetical protein